MGVKIKSALGSVTLDAENIASNTTVTVPAGGGTLVNTAPSTSGNILTSDGTNWTSSAPAAGADTSLSNLSSTGNDKICTAWVNFNGSVTPPTINDSYNVSSVVRTSTGYYTISFSTPMDNSNYATIVGGFGTGYGHRGWDIQTSSHTTSSISIVICSDTSAGNGSTDCAISIFGGKT